MTSKPRPEQSGSPRADWTNDELRASIEAYDRMLRAESRGAPLTKSDVVAELMRVTGRSKGSIEMRFQNISAVLQERGAVWIDGYKPLTHYPARLKVLIDSHPSLGTASP